MILEAAKPRDPGNASVVSALRSYFLRSELLEPERIELRAVGPKLDRDVAAFQK
jgi:hypothetical protein